MMNCPICNKELVLVTGKDCCGNDTYRYVCVTDDNAHFMTESYNNLEAAEQEVQSGNIHSRTSNMAYWKWKENEEVYCSNCKTTIGRCHTRTMYNDLVSSNHFCRACGRTMEPFITSTSEAEVIPRTITVQEYNKTYYKKHSYAESFIKLIDNAAMKSGAYEDVMKQLRCIGWPEVKPTLLAALEMYKQIMKSKCVGKTCKSEYRQVTLCENCGNCLTVTKDWIVCKLRGAMPVDGFCSEGLPEVNPKED